MNITIKPAKLHGTIAAIPSKSDLHRALICAAFSDAETQIRLPSPAVLSEDILATIRCLTALGATITLCFSAEKSTGGMKELKTLTCRNSAGDAGRCALQEEPDKEVREIQVLPVRDIPSEVLLDCGESGSTLRFLLPVCAALCLDGAIQTVHFTGHGRLPERPLSPLLEELEKQGCACSAKKLPLTMTAASSMTTASSTAVSSAAVSPAAVSSEPAASDKSQTPSDSAPSDSADALFVPHHFVLPGNISSQYITGLLLAAPLFHGLRIDLTTPLSSAGYVTMTVDTMRRFGVSVFSDSASEDKNRSFLVSSGSYHSFGIYECDGDWSNAAFFIAADAIGEAKPPRIRITGLREASVQGDRAVLSIVSELAKRREHACRQNQNHPKTQLLPDSASSGISAVRESNLVPYDIDADPIPDLVPVLAVLATLTPGETHFINGARLRLKESDRLHTVAEMIRALGGDVEERETSLIIKGKKSLSGGTVNSYQDHRIVMAAAVASCGCTGSVTILGAEASSKSYPTFWEDFTALHGNIT